MRKFSFLFEISMKKYRFATFGFNRTYILFFLVCMLYFAASQAQQDKELYTIVEYPVMPQKFSEIDSRVNESSGLIWFENAVLTFNDSGGLPEIYKLDPDSGRIEQTISLSNATNVDWEDIGQDSDFIYIGDFGNNRGNRTNLKIYKIAKKDIGKNNKVDLLAKSISFSYSDQHSFEKKNHENDFDCESLISFGDSLILFTKDWADGQTRMYKLPKKPGKYSVSHVSVFDVDGLVTGSDYNIHTRTLVLIGYKNFVPFIFYFKNFDGMSLGTAKVYRFNLNRMVGAQTEGICWLDDESVLLSNEQTKEFDQAVYKLNLEDVIKLLPND